MLDYPYATDFVTPMPASPVRYACALIPQVMKESKQPTELRSLAPDSNSNSNSNKHLHPSLNNFPASNNQLMTWLNDVINVYLNYTGQLKCHNFSNSVLDSRQHHADIATKRANTIRRTELAFGDAWMYQVCLFVAVIKIHLLI
jgi:hypothetical protein